MMSVTMPDILAIVSKAIFEKEAKHLGVGDVWPTAAYVSTNAGLSPLARGGRLFLVTVRPEFELWLVAVLEQPQVSKGAWRAATNTRPITNLTDLIPRITFANGKGLVRDAKLGMSLQSPRELPAATASLIGGAPAASAPTSKTPPQADAKPAPRVRSTRAKSSAKTEPARAAVVPEEKRWNAATSSWELGETDAHGCRQGTWVSWREDGTKRGETPYVDHDLHGVDRRFHPDGTVASEGRWERGILRDQVFFATVNPTDQLTVRQGGSVTVRTEFVSDASGRANATIRFFDKDGRQRDSSGALVPEKRPAGVPDTARWFSTGSMVAADGSTAGWVDGQTTRESNLKRGVWRWWSKDGELLFTAVMNDTGKVLQRVKPGDDEVERELEAFVAAPEPRASSIAQRWSPFLHERLRARLATAPPSLLREYVAILHEKTKIFELLWSKTISRPREIVELVEAWEARDPRSAGDVDAWFIFGAGARSAFELRDRERTERWWKRFLAIPTPTPKSANSSAFTSLVADLGKSGLVRKALEAWLSGKAEKNHLAIATRLSTSKTFASVEDGELAELVSARARSRPCRVMVRDKKTCEAWLVDDDGQSHYWKGDALAPTTVQFGTDALTNLMQADACDERRLYWPGKRGWLALQRYGRVVLWHAATYFMSRGQSEVQELTFFKAGSPIEAQRLMTLIAASKGKPIDPWEPPTLGVIFRRYKGDGDGIGSLGVNGNTLVTRHLTLEKFPTREAAVLAFESIELERIRTGGMIERFEAAVNLT